MNKRWLLITLMLLVPWTAHGGTEPAPNQSQPTSTTVTPSAAFIASQAAMITAAAAGSGSGPTITLNDISSQGVMSITIEATLIETGQTATIPATARLTIDGQQVIVTFDDGSTLTFSTSELDT